MAQRVKHLPAMQEIRVRSPYWEVTLEKERAARSSTLACKMPWTKEPGWLRWEESQRIIQDWATSLLLNQAAWHFFHLIRLAHPDSHSTLKQDHACALGVSLCSSKYAGKCVILKLEFQAICQNQYIPSVKSVDLHTQTSQENTLGHFSVHYGNSFGPFFEFSERNMLLATS